MTEPESRYSRYVGIDWASTAHQVVVLDATRRLLHERTVAHDGAALQEFAEWLAAQGTRPEQVAVAIEVPRGAVIDALLARGFHVFALNPKQLDRFRDRYTVAGAKDDRRDALVVAAALATDPQAFRQLAPEAPVLVELREVARLETTLQHDLRRLANRLYEQLVRYYPQVLHLCPAADEAWIWALLEQAPTPTAAARLSRGRVQRLLAQHRIRRVSPDEVLATLRRPPLPVMPGTVEAAQAHVRILLPQLQLLAQQATECAQHVAHLLEGLQGEPVEHRDVAILRSLPGVGRVVAATMLAEASRLLAHRDYHGLRVQAGVAPVTRQSGKRRLVVMRHACNPRLRNALHYWSQVSVQHDQPSREHYHRLRARGHSHARALRGVADRLLRVLVSMLATGTPYDESRRRRVAAATANAA